MIINFNLLLIVKQHLGESVTMTGNFKEIVYLDHHDNIIHIFKPEDAEDASAIWLNSNPGAAHNDKFSILIVGAAIKSFIDKYGVLTSQMISKYIATCNNVLLESMQGTDKPFVRIETVSELDDLLFFKISTD